MANMEQPISNIFGQQLIIKFGNNIITLLILIDIFDQKSKIS